MEIAHAKKRPVQRETGGDFKPKRKRTVLNPSVARVFRELRSDPEKPWLCVSPTWKAYIIDRWGLNPREVRQMIAAENVRDQLARDPQLSELAAKLEEPFLRELKGLSARKSREVVKAAMMMAEAAGKPITEGTVREARAVAEKPVNTWCVCPKCGGKGKVNQPTPPATHPAPETGQP